MNQPTVVATELVLRTGRTVRLSYVPGGDEMTLVLDAESSDLSMEDLNYDEARAIRDFIDHWLARPRVAT